MDILIIAPHPDDEVLGCGGLIAKNVEIGNIVNVIYLSSGEHGIPGTSIEDTAEIREGEARNVCNNMGIYVDEFWRLPDGGIKYTEALRDRMVASLTRLAPKAVYVTHERESHPDHSNAGKIVREAIKVMDVKPVCLTYEIWTPLQRTDRILNIDSVIDQKLGAAKLYMSQMERNHFDTAVLSLSRYRGIMHAQCQYAEAFCQMRERGENLKIAVALMTYTPSLDHPRAQYAYDTLESFLENVTPGANNDMHIHIADDGSVEGHVEKLVEICKKFGYNPSISNAERGGYGRSYNLICQALHSDFDMIFPLEDDWRCLRPLDLGPLVKAIENSEYRIQCIRLGFFGFTQEVRGTLAYVAEQTFLLLDPNSPEPHIFAGGPRIETVAFERSVGSWPEGIGAGYVEWEVTHRQEARMGVAWPMDLGIPCAQVGGAIFGHIGSVSVSTALPGAVA